MNILKTLKDKWNLIFKKKNLFDKSFILFINKLITNILLILTHKKITKVNKAHSFNNNNNNN